MEFCYIKYDEEEIVCKFDLMVDRNSGDLQVIPLCVADFIVKRILHLYEDEETGTEEWYGEIIIDVVTRH